MLEQQESTRLTRRNFLKSGAAIAGSAWAGVALGCSPAAQQSSASSSVAEEASASAEVEPAAEYPGLPKVEKVDEQVFRSCCKPNCFHGCMLNVTVREGKVVKTAPGKYPNEEYNRICLRGLTHPEGIYHPDRVLYPMRRIEGTERGTDEFERITWEEAIDEIATKFKKYAEEDGPASVMKAVVSGNYGAINGAFCTTFFNAINASSLNPSLDLSNAVGLNRVVGWAGTWVSNEARDLKNADTIFVWANNLTDAQIQEWHFLADAIEAGAKLVVVDPIYTQTAAKADIWVPVRPASDTALTLAMINQVIEEDRVDREFMAAYTVAPFLVKEDGMFLRMSDLGVEPVDGPEDPATGEPTKVDPIAVWDADANAAAELSTVANPALEGEFEANGIKVKTAFTCLAERAAEYPASRAATICDIPEETIVELAHLASEGKVTHRVGWGMGSYDNGVHPSHAGAALAAITGQMCAEGKVYGNADINGYGGWNAAPTIKGGVADSPTVTNLILEDVVTSGKFMGEDFPINALYIYCGNPMSTFVDCNSKKRALEGIDLVVTADSMMTDTALYSDIVLPCAQFFEYEDIVASGNNNYMVLSEKAIDPPGEAKPDTEIMRMLAEAMGLDIFPETNEEFLKEYLESETSIAAGLTWDNLQAEGVLRWAPDPLVRWTDHVFYTASGRMEFYVENPTPMDFYGQDLPVERERLPQFFEPGEAWNESVDEFPANEKAAQYPLILMSERPRFRTHSQFAYNKFLRELDPEPTVKINPATAQDKGLEDGSHVELFNDRGHCVAKLVYNEAIRPGVLVYPKSWHFKQHIAGHFSELSSSSHDPFAVNQSYFDALVDIRAWEGDN